MERGWFTGCGRRAGEHRPQAPPRATLHTGSQGQGCVLGFRQSLTCSPDTGDLLWGLAARAVSFPQTALPLSLCSQASRHEPRPGGLS